MSLTLNTHFSLVESLREVAGTIAFFCYESGIVPSIPLIIVLFLAFDPSKRTAGPFFIVLPHALHSNLG